MTLAWDSSEVRSKESLDTLVMNTWESMRDKDLCWTMTTQMRHRLEQVIDRGGEGVLPY